MTVERMPGSWEVPSRGDFIVGAQYKKPWLSLLVQPSLQRSPSDARSPVFRWRVASLGDEPAVLGRASGRPANGHEGQQRARRRGEGALAAESAADPEVLGRRRDPGAPDGEGGGYRSPAALPREPPGRWVPSGGRRSRASLPAGPGSPLRCGLRALAGVADASLSRGDQRATVRDPRRAS